MVINGAPFMTRMSLQILTMCNSRMPIMCEHACALLYVLARQNYSRVALDLTIAVSKIAGENYKAGPSWWMSVTREVSVREREREVKRGP